MRYIRVRVSLVNAAKKALTDASFVKMRCLLTMPAEHPRLHQKTDVLESVDQHTYSDI